MAKKTKPRPDLTADESDASFSGGFSYSDSFANPPNALRWQESVRSLEGVDLHANLLVSDVISTGEQAQLSGIIAKLRAASQTAVGYA